MCAGRSRHGTKTTRQREFLHTSQRQTRVAHTDRKSNTLTVARTSGEKLSYDPRRLQGVTVYRETERTFAEGDRVQMTAPYHSQNSADRELGTVDKIDRDGNLKLRMDSGREVKFNVKQHPHLDHGGTALSREALC